MPAKGCQLIFGKISQTLVNNKLNGILCVKLPVSILTFENIVIYYNTTTAALKVLNDIKHLFIIK